MSGHNKWSTIKHKKGAADAKRGKIFSRFSKEITLAVKLGGKDIDCNARLRSAVNAAKISNMPKENIDRAIKKGAGELGGAALEELSYEGYAPGGIAIMVECLSDNRNRTAAEIRNILSKGNGNLATTGAVSWMFHRKARFVVEGEHANEEHLLEICLDAGAYVEEITVDDGVAEIVGPPECFDDVVKALESAGIIPTGSGLVCIPENLVTVEDISIAKQVLRMLDQLEDYEDTQNVYANADIPDELLEALTS